MLFFVLNVKNDRLDATLIIIILAEYTGVIFTLTSGNVTWFYDRNFDFILKILWRYLFSYLFEKDKLIKRALAAWYLKKQKLEFNKNKMFQSYI